MYILDTNVISELRRPKPHGGVAAWIKDAPANSLYLAAITAGEIQAGIEITRRQDAAKAIEIEAWLESVLQAVFVLDANAAIFRKWAQLMDSKPDDLIEDSLIAATAIYHNMTVVTRNVRDFLAFPVTILNPFDYKSP